MPRIYCEEYNDPYDYCKECWNKGEHVEHSRYGGPTVSEEEWKVISDKGHEHPDYSDCEYECDLCHKKLTNKDN